MRRRFFLGSVGGVVAGLFGGRSVPAADPCTRKIVRVLGPSGNLLVPPGVDVEVVPPDADPLGAKEFLPMRYPDGGPNRVMRIFRLQHDGTAVEIPRQEVRAGDRVICVMAVGGRLTRCSAFTAASDWYPGKEPNLSGGEVKFDANFESWNLLTNPSPLPIEGTPG